MLTYNQHIYKQVTENDRAQPSITNHLDAYKKKQIEKKHNILSISTSSNEKS